LRIVKTGNFDIEKEFEIEDYSGTVINLAIFKDWPEVIGVVIDRGAKLEAVN